MRASLLGMLNELLELDHDATVSAFMEPLALADTSPLIGHRCTHRENGVSYLTGLDLIGLTTGKRPIVAVCDERVIQRFE